MKKGFALLVLEVMAMVRAYIEAQRKAFLLFCQYFMSTESILEIYVVSIKYKSIKVNTELKCQSQKRSGG